MILFPPPGSAAAPAKIVVLIRTKPLGAPQLPTLHDPWSSTMAVECVLVINNYGKPRLANFYRSLSTPRQQLLIRTIFKLVNDRPEGECNVLEAPELDALLARSASKSKANGEHGGGGTSTNSSAGRSRNEMKVIYRHYATLWFVFVVDQSESELAILDLIQVCTRLLQPRASQDPFVLSSIHSPAHLGTTGLRRVPRPLLPQRLRAGPHLPLRRGECDPMRGDPGRHCTGDEHRRDCTTR